MRHRLARTFVVALFVVQAAAATGGAALGRAPDPRVRVVPSRADPQLVFAAFSRDAWGNVIGNQQLYVAAADGSSRRQITEEDGLFYDWPNWALNGTKIVFTAGRRTPSGDQEEAIYLMNPDGTGRVKLTDNPWRNGQPKVSPDGRYVLFSSFAPEYVKVGIFRLDLETLAVENLSARSLDRGGLDGDPRWSFDGKRIVFASSYAPGGSMPTQIFMMNADGSGRSQLTDDDYFNTDPSLSPDGRFVVYSSYRGDTRPEPDEENLDFAFPLDDWYLVLLDLEARTEKLLTRGRNCAIRPHLEPCAANAGPGWVPHWSPDGRRIGYQSIRSSFRAGLYVMDADGTNAAPMVETGSLAISYWDWGRPGPAPSTAVGAVGSSVSRSRLLFGGSVFEQGPPPAPSLFTSGPDRWVTEKIEVADAGVTPRFARWTPDARQIVFTARIDVDEANGRPHPEPPQAQARIVHFTLDDLQVALLPRGRKRAIAREQIFLMDADGGNVRQVTSPWIEDYLAALPDGDARGNVDPDVSPDGRYLVFTNVSTLTFESYILRLDLRTGEVINLSSVTSGAVPVADSQPRYSPDGSKIAFVSSVGTTAQLFVMDGDGTSVRQLTDDEYYNAFPAWSPDGGSIAYSSYRGSDLPVISGEDLADPLEDGQIVLEDWILARLDVDSGGQTALTEAAHSPVLRPVWSPDGSRIAYISSGSSGQPDIFVVDADGGEPRAIAVTLRTKEEWVDWR